MSNPYGDNGNGGNPRGPWDQPHGGDPDYNETRQFGAPGAQGPYDGPSNYQAPQAGHGYGGHGQGFGAQQPAAGFGGGQAQFGGQGQYGQGQYGQGAHGGQGQYSGGQQQYFGGSTGTEPGGGKKNNMSTGVMVGIGGAVVAVIAVVAIAFTMLSGDGGKGGDEVVDPTTDLVATSEEDALAAAAEGANETLRGISESSTLVQWNDYVCEQYKGTVEGLRAADGFLVFLGGYDELFDLGSATYSLTADDVEFVNEDRTEARMTNGAEGLNFRSENGKWLVCDSNVDLSQFDDATNLGI